MMIQVQLSSKRWHKQLLFIRYVPPRVFYAFFSAHLYLMSAILFLIQKGNGRRFLSAHIRYLFFYVILNGVTLAVKERELLKIYDIISIGSVTLSEHGHLSDDYTACLLYEIFE